jgi:hypothetical protein
LRACAVALAAAALVAGCGLGPGERTEGEATLTVTRDFGAEKLVEATTGDPAESETVVRFLDREADIQTDYGGNFVSAIDGIAGSPPDGSQLDWFFYVNGYWSPVGAGEARVRAGDRIWWDYRDWSAAYQVSAVVGSFPEPFLHGYDGQVYEVEVDCLGGAPACDVVAGALEDAGVEPARRDGLSREVGDRTLRVLVGPWDRVREDPTARVLEAGPESSGVYAEMDRCGPGWGLTALGADGDPAATYPRAGLVAAVRRGEEQPTWVVTATEPDDVGDAAALVTEESLADHFAVASVAGEPVSLPELDAPAEGGGCP